jgi:hypothetical protein
MEPPCVMGKSVVTATGPSLAKMRLARNHRLSMVMLPVRWNTKKRRLRSIALPSIQKVDLRGRHPFTRHTHAFELPTSPSTAANERNPDKAKLKETILALRAGGWSYRQIGREVGLHWTRVGQILKASHQNGT